MTNTPMMARLVGSPEKRARFWSLPTARIVTPNQVRLITNTARAISTSEIRVRTENTPAMLSSSQSPNW